MGFIDALEGNRIPLAVGDVRLRYEPSLLIGERRRRRSGVLPDALWTLGAIFGVLTAAVLLVPNSLPSTLLGAGCAAVCGALVLAGMWAEGRRRARRGFVLNFGTESLRVDLPPARGRRTPVSWVVKFDAVRDVRVVERGRRRFGLSVRFDDPTKPGKGAEREELLVDAVAPGEIDDLRRLWRVLYNAFGLRGGPSLLER